MKIYDPSNNLVATLLDAVSKLKGKQEFLWDGKDDSNAFLDNGVYTLKLSAVDDYGKFSADSTYDVNYYKEATNINSVSLTSDTFTPNGSNSTTLSYTIDSEAKITIKILDSINRIVKTIDSGTQRTEGIYSTTCNGTNNSNIIVNAGTYTYKIESKNLAKLVSDPITGTITIL